MKPRIAIVGPGRLSSTLTVELARAGYRISEIVTRANQRAARDLARRVHARLATISHARLDAEVIWFCVPDRDISGAARALVRATDWRQKIALHSSGALASDELDRLRQRGAAVASVHPLMTFVSRSACTLKGVPFRLEGDARAARVGRSIVRDLGGEALGISKESKAAYHAWGTFVSPLLIATLVSAERVAGLAGISTTKARRQMLPIVRQTLENYGKVGPAEAFSGPLVRGDIATVREHLRVLRKIPAVKDVYLTLARLALRHLPVKNRQALQRILSSATES